MSIEFQDTCTYRKTTLDNGLRIVTEEVPHFRSVSLGLWVGVGSRFEAPELNGISHFIEHMLFKGTRRRSALDIAREIDSVGGGLNAFTSKEMSAFYCRVLHEHLELAVDLLTDIFLNASFPEEEIEREKRVVVQEIYQLEDSPEEFVLEMLGAGFWKGDPLGLPVLGTVPNVMAFDRKTLMAFKARTYTPERTIVCAAGRVEHHVLVEMIAERMASLPSGAPERVRDKPRTSPGAHVVNRDLEQIHVCLGTPAPSAVDQKRHAAYLLNTIFGSGMSSRLFQEVREKSALAYSVYSFFSTFSDSGLFGVYAACDPARIERLLGILHRESSHLATSIGEHEIVTAKKQLKGSVLLAMESSEARMNRLAKGEYFFGRYFSTEEILHSMERVPLEEVTDLAEEMMGSGSFASVALGPVDGDGELFRRFPTGE